MFFKKKNHVDKISDEVFKQLAKNNVKKSIKEYLIYFITISFGVVLLYSFNSIDNTLSNLMGNDLLNAYIYMAKGVLGIFSIVICLVFGFLITYSNNFLMKRRKNEFGIYITLGIDKKDINKLMFKENIIIGSLSLCIGLILGIFISQGLGIVIFKMINLSSKYTFFISVSAIIKTIVLFIFVLFLINILNKRSIQKYKLIDLIYSSKKNESFANENTNKNLIALLISILLILISYAMLKFLNEPNIVVISMCMVLLVISTYLFFISISDFVLKQIKKHKKLYYNHLTMFIINQISSRIKSISLAITIICLVIFSALIIIPFGMGFANYFKNDIGVSTPFDATVVRYNIDDSDVDVYNGEYIYSDDNKLINKKYNSLEDSLKNNIYYNNLISKSIEVNIYRLRGLTLNKVFNNISENDEYDLPIISVTDYNNVRKQQGLDSITLENNEFALNINNPEDKEDLKNNLSLNVNNNNLKYSNTYFNVYYNNNNVVSSNAVTIIVPDSILYNLYPVSTYLNVYYVKSNNEYDNNFLDKVFFNFRDISNDNITFESKLVIDGEKIAFNIIFSFISIYLGIILLVSAGAILALQQISGTSINKKRFNTLKKLGVKERELKKAIFVEVLVLFVMPLLLALFNFMIIYNVLGSVATELSKVGLFNNILISWMIIIIIYGIYFFISYYESVNIISKKEA